MNDIKEFENRIKKDFFERVKYLYTFNGDLTEKSLIKCSECGLYSILTEWREGETNCELCGEHFAIICPKCDAYHDHIYSNKLEIK